MSSKSLPPLGVPFFPTIFFTNQFRSTPVFPPSSLSLRGKSALVTGSNQGLGLEASTQLLSHDLSHLFLAVRNLSSGETAASALREKFPQAKIQVLHLDMSSYASIQSFAGKLEESLPERLDYTILNAGVRKMEFKTLENGEGGGKKHEETIQVNYLSTVLLCSLLLPVIKRVNKGSGAPVGRVTIVSSGLAFNAKFTNRKAEGLIAAFDDEKNFQAQDYYNTSKLLGMMFLWKLTEFVSAEDVVVNLVDPGFVEGTNLTTGLSFVQTVLFRILKRVAARSLRVGGSTYVDAAVVQGDESHGSYLMSWKISPFVDLLYTPEGKKLIERLWSETMTELSFADVQGALSELKKI